MEKKEEQTLSCIRCGRKMFSAFPHYLVGDGKVHIQPNDGLAFTTYGHYGSTYFDPFEERLSLTLVLCDVCTKFGEENGLIRRRTDEEKEIQAPRVPQSP